MKKVLIISAAILLSVLSSEAQYKWDFGVKAGVSNYLGDIGGQELTRRDFIWDMKLNGTRANYSVFARRKINKRWALAANVDYVSIWGFDSKSLNPGRVARNANFRNRMFELGGRAELTVFYDNDVGGKGYYNPDYRFFIFAGGAAFSHNPQAQVFSSYDADGNKLDESYKGDWIDTRPLRTENQESEYERFAFSVPVGAGMYFTFDKRWRFGWELNWRTTFTDYLDDVSTQYGDIDQIAERGVDAVAIAQQSNQQIINQINSDPLTAGQAGNLTTHQWTGYTTNDAGETVPMFVKRGDPTHNDSYVTMAFTASYVVRGTSSFYRAKYSWLKQRRGSRRSRAKF